MWELVVNGKRIWAFKGRSEDRLREHACLFLELQKFDICLREDLEERDGRW